MDKYEYKIRAEEIKALIAEGSYAEAAAIADTIDWHRVKSVMMLCTVSDLYKINRRYEDAKDMLLLAYERHPGGRSIVYSLCELCIKMDEVVQAVEYYKEFVQIAPKDAGRYILQYKLYEAQEVSLEERIEVLKELKRKDYIEKWVYELAYLYHRIGLATKCVEECNEMILMFGQGRYVKKAMELKMLHEPLTPSQQESYDAMCAPQPENTGEEEAEPEKEIQVKLMKVSPYDTINIQRELAANMKELWEDGSAENKASDAETAEGQQPQEDAAAEPEAQENPLPQQEQQTEAFLAEADGESAAETRVWKKEDIEKAVAPVENRADDEGKKEEPEEKQASTASRIMEQMKQDTIAGIAPGMPSKFESILGMEYDGQLSMVVPESEKIEKQITGQINLEDVLVEWEKRKKDNEQERMEAVRQHVLQQTGSMFTDFDASVRDGLLEKLEREKVTEEKTEIIELPGSDQSDEGWVPAQEPSEEASEEETTVEETAVEETVVEETTVEETAVEETAAEDTVVEETTVEETTVEETASEETASEEEAETPDEAEEAEADEYEEEEDSEAYEDNEEAAAEEDEFDAEESEEEDTGEEAAKEGDAPEEKRKKTANKSPRNVNHRKARALTEEEQQVFASFIQNKKTRDQLANTLDNISLAAYTGNVVISGEENTDTMNLARTLVKEVQQTDNNFSGKIAKISAESLNKKEIGPILKKLANGALIIQKGSGLNKETVGNFLKELETEENGLVVFMEDTKTGLHQLFKSYPELKKCFTNRIDIEALDNDSLVEYGKVYAKEQEYSIDDLGILALHTSIAERQTSDHAVTAAEVRDIVDEAISHANRKTLGHFFDILVAKRYDDEDMIILRENDF